MTESHKNYTNTKYNRLSFWISLFIITACLIGCGGSSASDTSVAETAKTQETTENIIEKEQGEAVLPEAQTKPEEEIPPASSWTEFDINEIPVYSGTPYTAVNNNVPYFDADDLKAAAESFEQYAELDALGRCGVAYASIGTDIMPTEERGAIGQIKPSGWHLVKYDVVDGKYLYNRCHLIGFQLAGENANEKNLITGTRYLNVDGMLPFENLVADYVKETGNHVLYRVTPIFNGDDLVASGVLMEAESVEDSGKDILFCVYVYNAQPGVSIDYATGESYLDAGSLVENKPAPQDSPKETPETPDSDASNISDTENTQTPVSTEYILNTNTKKFHYASCDSVKRTAEKNKQSYSGSREDIIGMGYEACKSCNP